MKSMTFGAPSPERAAVMDGASVLWSKPTESERFEVVG